MNITNSELSDLKKLYSDKYGKVLTDEEAIELANKLLNLVKVIGKRLPELYIDKHELSTHNK